MSEKLHLTHHTVSFQHAFAGLFHTFSTQPNLQIHLTLALLVLLAGCFFSITTTEWLLLLFTIMWVLTAEMVNTTIEAIVNLITTEYHESAKIAKDVAAGMVLVGALGSVVVGCVIFIPHIINLF